MRWLFIFLFVSQSLFAQKAEDVFTSMKDKLFGSEAAVVEFGFIAKEQDGDLIVEETGLFEFQGNYFKITTENNMIYNDGESKWIYDINNNEVVVMPSGDGGILDDPLGFLREEDNYSLKKFNRGNILFLRLNPKDKSEIFDYIDIELGSNYSIKSIDYVSKNEEVYTLVVNSLKSTDSESIGYYRFPENKFEDLIVTDLR